MTETISTVSWARSSVWLVSANVLRNLGLLAVLVALAQLTDEYVLGRYALALALTSPVFVFAQLGLKGIYLTIRGRHRFSSFVVVQGFSIVLAFAVSVLAAAIINPELVSTVALVCLVKAVDCGFELGAGALQRYGRTDVVFWSYLTAALLGTVVVVVILLMTRNLDLALAGLGVVNAVVALVSALRLGRRLARRHESADASVSRRQEIRSIIAAGLPTGIAAAVLALVSSLPQYFLAATRDEATVGYFAVLLYLVAIADIFGGTLTQAWIPSARERLERHKEGFLRFVFTATARWTLIFLPLLLLGLWLASLLLPVAFSPEYRIDLSLAVALGAAIFLLPLLHFGGTAIAVLNRYVHNLTLSVVAASASFVACFLLVPAFGLVGAVWATVIAFLARALAAVAVLLTPAGQDNRRATPPRR